MNKIKEVIKVTSSIRLLYVEDNENARNATMILFNEFFKSIIVAVDGLDGLEKFKTNNIDLIITDVNMPNLNGLKMIDKIREIDPEIPIIVLSAYSESNYFMESIKCGIDAYLIKPIDIGQLVGLLQRMIEKIELKKANKKYIGLMNQYQEIIDKSAIVSKADIDGIITYANEHFCEVSEYSLDELVGKKHNIVKHHENPKELYEQIWDTIKTKKQIWQGVYKNKTKSDKTYYLKTTIKPILDDDNNIVEFISISNNITEIMNPRKRLHDFVGHNENMVVVFIKIDEFENLSNFLGEKVAEKFQDEFTKILNSTVQLMCNFSKVYQLGNGEYAIAKDISNDIQDINDVIEKLKNFNKVIEDSHITIEKIDYDISVQVSMAYGKNSLENAHFGLKQLENTKQTFIIANNFVEVETKQAAQNLITLQIIKKAIDNNNIISYFQPIIDNKTKSILKYESLVRLVDDELNVVLPAYFLDVAKKSKYYSKITSIVLDSAFEALDIIEGDVSINLSMLDIEKSSTKNKLFKMIKDNKDKAHRIILELLEAEETNDFDAIKGFINDVKSMGVKIAIDDFGTGYSNLKRLLDYQPDILKIDGSLIKDIETDTFSLSIVKTIVAFAKERNIKTVAEYVETEVIYDILCKIDVDYSQGYLFGKPQTLSSVTF